MTACSDLPWAQIDAWIYDDALLPAIRVFWERTGSSLPDSVEAIQQRRGELFALHPERFKTDTDYRRAAFEKLRAVSGRIVVIEGSWDGDSRGWFIGSCAITEQPSAAHPKYTEHGLYLVHGLDRQVERAVEFGTALAQMAGVPFYSAGLEPEELHEERRWWDEADVSPLRQPHPSRT